MCPSRPQVGGDRIVEPQETLVLGDPDEKCDDTLLSGGDVALVVGIIPEVLLDDDLSAVHDHERVGTRLRSLRDQLPERLTIPPRPVRLLVEGGLVGRSRRG